MTYIEEGDSESSSLQVERGDVYNFDQGTILYIQSNACGTRERLQIYAIFTSDSINADDPRVRNYVYQYQSINNLYMIFFNNEITRMIQS